MGIERELIRFTKSLAKDIERANRQAARERQREYQARQKEVRDQERAERALAREMVKSSVNKRRQLDRAALENLKTEENRAFEARQAARRAIRVMIVNERLK